MQRVAELVSKAQQGDSAAFADLYEQYSPVVYRFLRRRLDGSDEVGCPVFMCKSGETIPEVAQCDGFADCEDSSDEMNCPVFMCGSGEEVPLKYKCDGFTDCRDGSDEKGCP